ncbi:hypothetical protein EMPS_06314 [Entomortierella parvispora]|uniref:Uncharacterized protein n=1 Tax=Entomortierella parvispora TaxID=205924 RepID=A0A9P3HC24_9FUNG|nr:hypothetical protein EMPS_06314 [Entomortierella parvispora]
MMFFESDAIAEFEQASKGLGTNANAPGYEDRKKILKDVIGKGIHSPEHYQHLIDIAAPKVKRPKYVLTGDISTNGYDLRVMAYKLTEKKRRALPAASSTPNVADPATSSLLAIEVGANIMPLANCSPILTSSQEHLLWIYLHPWKGSHRAKCCRPCQCQMWLQRLRLPGQQPLPLKDGRTLLKRSTPKRKLTSSTETMLDLRPVSGSSV